MACCADVGGEFLYGDKTGEEAGLSVGVAMLDEVPNEIPAVLRQQVRLQAGIVSRKQATRAGLSADKIVWLLKKGAWRQVYKGVYATFTGHITRNAQLWAAVLYAGRGAYLSYETAAEINRLAD